MLRSSCIRRSAAASSSGFTLKSGISTTAALLSIMGLWLSLTQIRTLNVELNEKDQKLFLAQEAVASAEEKYKKEVASVKEQCEKALKAAKEAAEVDLKKEAEMRQQIEKDLKKMEAEWKSLKKKANTTEEKKQTAEKATQASAAEKATQAPSK